MTGQACRSLFVSLRRGASKDIWGLSQTLIETVPLTSKLPPLTISRAIVPCPAMMWRSLKGWT